MVAVGWVKQLLFVLIGLVWTTDLACSAAQGLMRSELQAESFGEHRRSQSRHTSLAVELRGAVRGLRSASIGARPPVSHNGTLFCYSLVRAPPLREETVPLLARQLAVACDGWAFFSSAADDKLNIIKAYSHSEEQQSIKHQMHEMVAAGVWRKLAEMGAIEQYKWVLKVDADTFVRPSTLRRTFGDISVGFGPARSWRKIVSVGDASPTDGTSLEGFFLAVPSGLGTALLKGSATSCDVLFSGHNEEADLEEATLLHRCLENVRFDGFMTLRDPQGFPKVIFDQDEAEAHEGDAGGPLEYGPKICQEMASAVLKHSHRHGGKPREPLCECTLGGQPRPTCVSEDFVAIHKVASANMYSALAKSFV